MSTAPFVPIRVSERPPPVPRQARQLIGQSHERILALSPRLDLIAHAQAQYAALATFDNSITLDTRLRELVTLHASQINGCAFCIDMHWRAARTAGESEERLYLLGAWREADYYSDRERAALELCEAITVVTQGHVPADVWERAAAVFDRDELAQVGHGGRCDQRMEPHSDRAPYPTRPEPRQRRGAAEHHILGSPMSWNCS
jgi:AhpD family alkylhydroperoxidase